MADKRAVIIDSIEKGDYHQAEMYIKSCAARYIRDRKFEELDVLIRDVLGLMVNKPKAEIKDVWYAITLEWKHDN